jgi:uncharacterized membrane protein
MIRLLWDRLETTIWFIPALLSVLSLGAAVLLVNIDMHTDHRDWVWLEFFRIGTTGVRQVLAVTTGAMMTVTGVVFSISVVTLTLAANQFGAKLLRNYLGDTHNKLVLGLFIGSFLYGLVVLASIDSDPASNTPTLAFMVSLVLTMIAIGGLIYFIHNISTSIQADRLIALIGRGLRDTVVDTLAPCADSPEPAQLGEHWRLAVHDAPASAVAAESSGYVELIDYAALLDLATQQHCAVEIPIRPGDFVVQGNTVAVIYSLDEMSVVHDNEVCRHISLGAQRTALQDLEYSIMQLLQIALRALSPGINDSLTAIACVDWLGAALACMADRRFEAQYRADADGTVRLKLHTFDFAGAVDAVFTPLRQNARGNEMVTIRLLETLAAIMQVCSNASRLEVLRRHAESIHRTAEKHCDNSDDLEQTTRRYTACLGVYRHRSAVQAERVCGSLKDNSAGSVLG